MSQASASSQPPPRAKPLTAAIQGCGAPSMAATTLRPSNDAWRASSGLMSRNSAMSAPATKAFSPAPVSTTARTSASPAISSATASNSRLVAVFRAFITSGRVTVTTATAPSRLTSTAMGGPSLRSGGPRSTQGNSTPRASARSSAQTRDRRVSGRAAGESGAGRRQNLPPAPALATSAARGGLGSSGGRASLAADSLSARRGPERSRATFTVGGRVCFPLAHPANYPHRASTSHSRPLSARFDRPGAHATGATTTRARTRPIVVLRESVVNRALSFVSTLRDRTYPS